jgi:alpha-tubulin suppressor-like RCC1 family protein
MSGILSMIAGGTYSSAPVNTVAPVVSGTATRGQTLSSTTGTWTGKPDPTFAYQWQRAGSNIGGATSSTYVLVSADVGNAIRCVVTATNVVAAVSANSNATAAVAGLVAGAPTIGTATAVTATSATVDFTAPADNGGLTITSYTATSSPSGITGTLSQSGSGTITVSGLATDTAYTFTVTATNSAGTSAASASSNSVTPIVSGALWSWGRNVHGQLGNNTSTYFGFTTGTSSPIQVGSDTNWKSAKAGRYSSFAVRTTGTLWSWGQNEYGKLGLNIPSADRRSSPTQVGGDTNWLRVTGFYSGLAHKTNGTLWSLGGFNGSGQLGDGTYTSRSSPVQIGSDTDWATSDGGFYNMGAIKTGGTLYTWGQGSFGGQGRGGSNDTSNTPLQVGALTNWKNVAAGTYWMAAVKTDGTLWAWGRNNKYQVAGIGNASLHRSSPVQIGSDTNWLKVAAGYNSHLAIKTNGTLWITGEYDAAPKQIGALTNWTHAEPTKNGAARWNIGRTSSGNLYGWGSNTHGQLGLNNATYIGQSDPTVVGSDTNWTNLTTPGAQHTVAIRT